MIVLRPMGKRQKKDRRNIVKNSGLGRERNSLRRKDK